MKNLNSDSRLPKASWEKSTGVRWCTKHTGKMKGIYSLSTYRKANKFCLEYSKNTDLICHFCYVFGLEKLYGQKFVKKYVANTEILNSEILKEHLSLDRIAKQYFRFEAFGDLQSVTQVANYFQICNDNPNKSFALWTKNPFIIEWAINEKGYAKPKNLQILYSSPKLNITDEGILKKFNFIDKVFTVYTKDYINQHNIDINCGARDCVTCLKCYKANNVKFVREKLK